MNLSKIEKTLKEKNMYLYVSSHIDAARAAYDLGGYEEMIAEAIQKTLGTPPPHGRGDWVQKCRAFHKNYFMEIALESECGVNAYCDTLEECFQECVSTFQKLYGIDLSEMLR